MSSSFPAFWLFALALKNHPQHLLLHRNYNLVTISRQMEMEKRILLYGIVVNCVHYNYKAVLSMSVWYKGWCEKWKDVNITATDKARILQALRMLRKSHKVKRISCQINRQCQLGDKYFLIFSKVLHVFAPIYHPDAGYEHTKVKYRWI